MKQKSDKLHIQRNAGVYSTSLVTQQRARAWMDTEALVQSWLAEQAASGLSRETVRWNAKWGAFIASHLPDYPPTPSDITAMLAATTSDTTRHHAWQNFRQISNYAERALDLPNHARRVKPPRKPKASTAWLTMDQVRAMFRAARNAQDAALLTVMFGAGLRIGEVAGLRYEDVTPSTITVTGKGGRRVVPTPPTFTTVIRRFGEAGPIFRDARDGHQLKAHTLRNRFRELARAAGVPVGWQHPHVARHTFARHYWLATGDVAKVMVALGHSNVSMTLRYTHPHADDLVTGFAAESPIAGAGLAVQLDLFDGEERLVAELTRVGEAYRIVRPPLKRVTDFWQRYPDRVRGPSECGPQFQRVVTLADKARLTGLHHTTLMAIRDGKSNVSERAEAAIHAVFPDVLIWTPENGGGGGNTEWLRMQAGGSQPWQIGARDSGNR